MNPRLKLYEENNPSPVRAVETSMNRKTGIVSATYVTHDSCPRDCLHHPDNLATCYGLYGPLGFNHMARMGRAGKKMGRIGQRANPDALAELEADQIDMLTGRYDLRLHVVGDCVTERAARTVAAACDRYKARGRMASMILFGHERTPAVWGYTHAWKTVPREAWGTVSMLASCEKPEEVEEANRRGYAAALLMPRFPETKCHVTDAGVTVLPCPEETRGEDCVSCRLCMNDRKLLDMGVTIAFKPRANPAAERLRHALPMAN